MKHNFRRLLQVALLLGAFAIADTVMPLTVAEAASASASKSRKRRSSRKKSSRKKKRRRTTTVRVLWKSDDGSQWIRKGARGIIVSKDSAGVVRAMSPFTNNPYSGADYAAAVSDFARELAPDSVRVYSVLVPTQGEYYMPELTSTMGNEQRAIETLSAALDTLVTPVFLNDTLKAHLDEEIYNRTDHHWSPLGAFYASSALAAAAGVPFRPLEEYTTGTVGNYVGTMYKFSGDPEVRNAPETFVYFMPPEGYVAQFVDYRVSGGRAVSETPAEVRNFFVTYPDGSGAAYCTFMGGDYHTVKVSNTGGTPGRRLLIVKDSCGNAMAPALFGSFEEVHVIDHRYYPHSLLDYVRTQGITDLVFENSTQLAFAPVAAEHIRKLFNNTTVGNEFSSSTDESRK